MQLQNTFTVPVPVEVAWRVLLDVEQIAPCMPGATVESVTDDEVQGRVKVKLGPIAITYRGTVTFLERDESARRVVMSAAARETRGSGTASATITTVLQEKDGVTEVAVETDLNVTGKPAQFGRGVMADVSRNIIQQFADCLAHEIQAGTLSSRDAGSYAETSSGVRSSDSGPSMAGRSAGPGRPAEALDLLGSAGGPVMQRAVPVMAAIIVLSFVVWLLRGRRG
jgi:carbon monoxide dehydrogenase subunit G